MKFILSLVFAISVLSTHANNWTAKSTFPGSGRQLASGFSIGDKGYICCGLDTGYNNDLWEYDAVADAWTQKANMPGLGRFGAVAFSINGKGYVGTGGTSIAFYKDFWEYNPITNSWLQMANFGGHARQRAAGFSAAGNGYICCGEDLFNVYDDIWEWNPLTNVWIQKAPIPVGRLGPASFVINDKAYIVTGYNSAYLNDNWQFDPAANSWTQKAVFPAHGRTDASSFAICDKGFLGSGGESPYYDDFWEYSPFNDSWTQQTNFPGGRLDDCFYFAAGMKGYVGSGQPLGVGYTRQVWEFTPDSVCAKPITRIEESRLINQSLSIFPNPFNDKLFVKYLDNAPVELCLFDVTSRKIYSKTFLSETTIETESLERGLYLFEIRSHGILINSGKIIKD